jgi:hypothetical protein
VAWGFVEAVYLLVALVSSRSSNVFPYSGLCEAEAPGAPGLSLCSPFSKGGCSLHTPNIRYVINMVAARYLSGGRSAGACKYFMYKSSTHRVYQAVVSKSTSFLQT